MDSKRLLALQSQRGARSVGKEANERSLEQVLSDCRRFIQDSSDSYRDLDPDRKRAAIKELIIKFVMNNPVLVTGYVDDLGKADTTKLVDKLTEDITDYGILTQAMIDPEVYEIRCNGKEIKVEIAGHVDDLKDKDGHIISFETTDQQDIIIRKLLGDIRLTPKDAIVNGRTVEGYRIAAVHSSAMSPDPLDPAGDCYHAFVLRKFKQSKMGLPDIVKFGTLSDNMARLLSLMPKGGLTWFTVGPTASGKTTLNNAILQEVPATTRTVLIQNPSEIDLRFRDPSGRVYNDVLHLEAKEKDNPKPADATMQNLMAHTLRLSPTFVCFGELRTNPEFKLGMQIAQAGHPINCTFHAESSAGAIRRFLTAYLAESGNEPSDLALLTLTDLVKIIVVQKIMRDGTRKIIQISEVLGVDDVNPNKPALNDLYIFELEDRTDYDESGNVKKIHGKHKRVGRLSPKTVRTLMLEGVTSSQYDFVNKDVDPDEIEEYTGQNIKGYGMKHYAG